MYSFSKCRRVVLAGLIGTALTCALPGNLLAATEAASPKKPLVVYYSYSGNTKKLAEMIHDKVGGDLLEIKTSFQYPSKYEALTEVAKAQQGDNFRPPLDMQLPNLEEYDVVYLGYPNWWSSMAMPVYTFVEKSGLNGKTVIPFCTHGGGGLGHSVSDLKKLIPDSKVHNALAVSGSRVSGADKEVSRWLGEMGIR